MQYNSYKDIRAGDIVVIPGHAGQLVSVFVHKRLRSIAPRVSENRIVLGFIHLQSAIDSKENPEILRLQVSPTRSGDVVPFIALPEINKVGRVKIHKEEKVVYSIELAGSQPAPN